jgi:PPOX class probable F420-dependent enzyme
MSELGASEFPGSALPASVVAFLATGPLAHVVTIDPNGEPQVSVAWVGVEDGEVVIGTMGDQAKLRNIRANPRIAMSFAAPGQTQYGLAHYLVLRGRARVTEGGAADLLQRLAYTYIRPGVRFPGIPNPPPGYVIRMTVERIAGLGDWA